MRKTSSNCGLIGRFSVSPVGSRRRNHLLYKLGQPSLARHASEGALDDCGEGRIVAPIHKAVGIVRQIFADDLHAARILRRRHEAVEQHVVGGERVRLAADASIASDCA